MASDPLFPGQYKIGEFVFGEKTLFRVEKFDVGGYDVNVQDYQVSQNDELHFGQDSLKPLPIQMEINAFVNRELPNMTAISPVIGGDLDFSKDPKVGAFAREWRDDDVRKVWGELKSLYVCREDSSVVRIYGRPGKLSVSKRPIGGMYHKIVAEFRRSDTLAYSDFEWYLHCRPLETIVAGRSADLGMGDAPTWLRMVIVGPATHPIIQFGDIEIDLNVDINAGEMVEINSYPWQRRVISLPEGVNYASLLNQPYLDEIKFPEESAVEVSWNATNVNASVEYVNFDNYGVDLDSLPDTDWVGNYQENPGAGGFVGSNGTQVLWTRTGGNTSKTGVFRYKIAPTLTDYQLVGCTLDSMAQSGLIPMMVEPWNYTLPPFNRLIARANENLTEYVYMDFNFFFCWLGIHYNGIDTKIGPAYVIETIYAKVQKLLNSFWTGQVPTDNVAFEFAAGTGRDVNSFDFRIDNTLVVSCPAFDYIKTDEDHRWTGFGMRATTGVTQQLLPGPMLNWWMRDNPPAELADQINVSQLFVMWRDAWNVV